MRTCMMLISMLLSCVHILVYKRNFRLENFVLINDANEYYTNSCMNTKHITIIFQNVSHKGSKIEYLNVNDFFNFGRFIAAIIIPCMMCSITFVRLSELIIVYTDHVQNCSLTLMLMTQYQN